MNSPEQLRSKAIKLLQKGSEDTRYLLIDYTIDDECRRLFKLPPRPVGVEPYVGWMIGGKDEAPTSRRTSKTGIDLIKRWEGLRVNAYLCPANVWTIGYGHTKTARPGLVITHSEAERLLKQDLEVYEKAVRDYTKVPLTQSQFDALVSFTYNVGVGAFKGSTLLRLLNRNDYEGAANQFCRWVRGGGRELPGLVNRRKDEYKLFTRK